MHEYRILEFLNKEFLQYSNYKVVQQLPNFHDGLSQTARKEIWVLLKHPDKKIKTTDIYSLIYNEMKYLHGDKSAFNVFESLAADYKNNINLIEAKANFGYRTNQQAAAARYASAKISELARLVFPKEDYPIMEKQYLEGAEIEPPTLYPIIPLAIINGFEGIAVGFSSSILPRDPKKFIENLINLLNGKENTIKKIPLKFPYFKGTVEEDGNSFILKGIIKKGKSTKKTGNLIIEEVPYGYDREKMIAILQSLEDQSKIINYTESCIKNNFYFIIKVPIEIYNKTEEQLIDLFKLKVKKSENLTFLYTNDKEKTIREYSNVLLYLKDWILERLSIYTKRKNYIIKKIQEEINVIQSKIKFINEIIKNTIEINDKSKSAIVKQLEDKKYLKIDNKFDYLLNMPIYTLSKEKISELKNKLKDLQKTLKEIQAKSEKEFWVEDLEKLLKKIPEK